MSERSLIKFPATYNPKSVVMVFFCSLKEIHYFYFFLFLILSLCLKLFICFERGKLIKECNDSIVRDTHLTRSFRCARSGHDFLLADTNLLLYFYQMTGA